MDEQRLRTNEAIYLVGRPRRKSRPCRADLRGPCRALRSIPHGCSQASRAGWRAGARTVPAQGKAGVRGGSRLIIVFVDFTGDMRELEITWPQQFVGHSGGLDGIDQPRSEEHTSDLQSLMRISYDVVCLQTK